MTDPNRMDQERKILTERIYKERKKMTKSILNLTMEIIYLLTGEDYTVVKKTACECMTTSFHPYASAQWKRSQGPTKELLPPSLIVEKNKEKKILEVIDNIIKLLTGEVPIRCQDVTVYFSMEEWEYIEGHKDLYKGTIMENPLPLISAVCVFPTDGSSDKNTPERCPRPLYSRDSTKENHDHSQDDQVEDLIIIKVEGIDDEETYVRGDELCKEIPPKISTDGRHVRNIADKRTAISPDGETDDGIASSSSEEAPLTPDLHTTDLLSDPSTHGRLLPDCSPPVTHHTPHRVSKTRFMGGTNIITHRPAHAGEMPYSCTECGKYFPWKALLIRHQRTHTGEKPFSCSVCGKCFAQKSILVRHEKVHVDDKPFSCSECGKSFRQKSDLAIHERVHTAEKPFSCPECGQCFTQRGNLMSHLRRHTGVKPFSCSECGKCFSWKMLLIKHQRMHTGEKPYSCSACGKCFTDKANLLQHERIHTGDNPYTCPHCGRGFAHKSSLVRHERLHMGD
ncbi:oocyte zinc finger protein XlCOF7.1-like isoform X1 [Aquarana catesbeiana]|uniref:oocyte zinc finger protein XlCOF7.1-like isoform X1 n=1 Tax=Aquarana catesbeiana TaxID=8400 RepID=UPI003CC9C831